MQVAVQCSKGDMAVSIELDEKTKCTRNGKEERQQCITWRKRTGRSKFLELQGRGKEALLCTSRKGGGVQKLIS